VGLYIVPHTQWRSEDTSLRGGGATGKTAPQGKKF